MQSVSNKRAQKYKTQQKYDGIKVSLWTHDQSFCKHDWIISNSLPFQIGDAIKLTVGDKSVYLLIKQFDQELLSKHPQMQVSLSYSLAQLVGVQSRSDAIVQLVSDQDRTDYVELNYVEFIIKDQYVGRGDMFRLKSLLQNDLLYVNQRINQAAGVRVIVNKLFSLKSQQNSGEVTQNTKFIFRSESAKFYIFIPISSDFQLEIVCQFLLDLFSKWMESNVNHIVSIVLCSRVFYNQEEVSQLKQFSDSIRCNEGLMSLKFIQNLNKSGNKQYIYYSDYYKVLFNWETRQNWIPEIKSIQRELKLFKKDVLFKQVFDQQKGSSQNFQMGIIAPSFLQPVMESINLALNMFSRHYIDRDLSRTGLSIAVISQSHGLYCVPKEMYQLTNERMIEDGIGLDLVCILERDHGLPLHKFPIFLTFESQDNQLEKQTVKNKDNEIAYQMPSWIDLSIVKPNDVTSETLIRGRVNNSLKSAQFNVFVPRADQIPFNFNQQQSFDQNIQEYGNQTSNVQPSDNKSGLISQYLNQNNVSSLSKASQKELSLQISQSLTTQSLNNQSLQISPPRLSPIKNQRSRPISIVQGSPGSKSLIEQKKQSVQNSGSPQITKYQGQNKNIEFGSYVRGFVHQVESKSQQPSSQNQSFDPCSQEDNYIDKSHAILRWHHINSSKVSVVQDETIKWSSLCSPACLPLTTDFSPTLSDLNQNYFVYSYSISINEDSDLQEDFKNIESLLNELLAQRLMQGFQLIVGDALKDLQKITKSLDSLDVFNQVQVYYLSMGSQIHLLYQDPTGKSIQVKRYVKKPLHNYKDLKYSPLVWPKSSEYYILRNFEFLFPKSSSFNWNYLDNLVSGYEDELTDSLRHWKSRFVLIPQDSLSQNIISYINPDNETLTDEEIRLASFMKFIEVFHKQRWITKEERQSNEVKKEAITGQSVSITYSTQAISAFVKSEVNKYNSEDPNVWIVNSIDRKLASNERLSMDLSFQIVAAAMQNQNYGLQLKDRRWHLRYYEKAFIGSEAVDWLIKNFLDINTREQAVAYGELLLQKNVIEHVNQRHKFLDGHYFYKICSNYLISSDQKQENRNPLRWFKFSSGSEKEINDKKKIPFQKIQLSRKLTIDLDAQKKSNRKEWAYLHYDTIHNPKNAYHFQLHWLICSSRLVEEVILSWQRTAEKCGMKLIEVPMEQQSLKDSNDSPFSIPLQIQFKIPPQLIKKSDLDGITNASDMADQYFEQHFLYNLGYILDIESDNQIDQKYASYSFTKPYYQNTQFIHKSGLMFVQIVGNKNGFLLSQNQIHINHNFNKSPIFQQKHISNQQLLVEQLKKEFIEKCQDDKYLQKFYNDTSMKFLRDCGVDDVETVYDAIKRRKRKSNNDSGDLLTDTRRRFRALSVTSSSIAPILSPEVIYSSDLHAPKPQSNATKNSD